jgi:1-acyl-sn-glycerol-3-phosphate acyltransferase
MGSIKVRKTSNFSGVGRTAIVISNHAGILDPWIIFSSLPLPVFYRLLPVRPYATLDFKKENRLLRFFKKTGITGAIYYLYNVIAISRNGSFEEKINPLVHALQKKDSVLMFPEGSISTKEVIRPFKKGVVELYRRTGVPILPCVLKYRKRGILFYKIEVVFGEPLHIPKEILEGGGEFHMNSIEFLENKLKKLYEYV